MKVTITILLLAIIAYAGYSEWSEWRFQSYLLKSSGLKVSRSNVDLQFEANHSSNFGADSVTVYGFAVNDRESLLEECGKGGYSVADIIDPRSVLGVPSIPSDEDRGCYRRQLTDNGATQIFLLLQHVVYIKNMS